MHAVLLALALIAGDPHFCVPFRLAMPDGAAFDGLARVGVGFPRGSWSGERPVLVRAGARTTEAQHEVLSRHGDGTVRFAALIFPAKITARALLGCEAVPAPVGDERLSAQRDESLRVAEVDGGFEVETGAVRFFVPADAAVVLRDLAVANGRVLVARATAGTPSGEGKVRLEASGPFEVRILQEGRVGDDSGGAGFHAVRRIIARRGEAGLDIETWFESGASTSGTPISLVLELGGRVRAVRSGTGRFTPGAAPRELSFGLDERGAPTSALLGWTGVGQPGDAAVVASSGGDIGLVCRDALHLRPTATAVLGDRTLSLALVSGTYHHWQGTRAGRAVRLTIGERLKGPPSISRPIVLQRPLDLPDWPSAAGACDGATQAVRGTVDTLIARALEPANTTANGIDWRGEENAGDWRWSKDDAGNLEFDTTYGRFARGITLAAPPEIAAAERSARHWAQRDIDWARGGLPIRHGAFHRTGGIEAGHIWLDGPLWASLASADPFLVEAAERVAANVTAFAQGSPQRHWNTRSVGWMLHALCAAHAFRPSVETLDALRKTLDTVAEAPGGRLTVFERFDEETDTACIPTWVLAGILADGAVRAAKIVGGHPAVGRARAAVEALVDEAWDPKERRLADGVVVTRSGEVVRTSSGACTGEQMLFFHSGVLAVGAPPPSSSALFLDLAAKSLHIRQKRLVGMELSQLLWLHPRLFPAAR